MLPFDYIAIKEFLRENLQLTAELIDPYGPDQSVRVSLQFKGEYPFSTDYITIPGER